MQFLVKSSIVKQIFNEKMELCWKVGLVYAVLLVMLILVVSGAEKSSTKSIQKLDKNGLQRKTTNFASNETDFKSLTNERRLNETSQKKGTAELKKIPLDSSSSTVIKITTTTELPTLNPVIELNKLKPTTNQPILKQIFKVMPNASDAKKKAMISPKIAKKITPMTFITTVLPVTFPTTDSTTPLQEVTSKRFKVFNKDTSTVARIDDVTPTAMSPTSMATQKIKLTSESKNLNKGKSKKLNSNSINKIFIYIPTTVRPRFRKSKTAVNKLGKASGIKKQKPKPCPYVFDPVCATQGGIEATFTNECMVNAENLKTGKGWKIFKDGPCDEYKIHTPNTLQKDSHADQKEVYANSPTILELVGDDIVFEPLIERTDYEDGPVIEHSHPLFRSPTERNFIPRNKQFFPPAENQQMSHIGWNNQQFYPFYQTPRMSNFRQNNEPAYTLYKASPETTDFGLNNQQLYTTYEASPMTNFITTNEQPYLTHGAPTLMDNQYSPHFNPLLNARSLFSYPVSYDALLSNSHPMVDNSIMDRKKNYPQDTSSVQKRYASYQRKHLPCKKTFNPVCAIFGGVKSTFINECQVNEENIKTGSTWTVFSRGICAEDYDSTLNKNTLRSMSSRSNKNSADHPKEQESIPKVIHVQPMFQTDIIKFPYHNYDPSAEQKIFRDTYDYSPLPPIQRDYEASVASPVNYDISNNAVEPIRGIHSNIFNKNTPLQPREESFENNSKNSGINPNEDNKNYAPFETKSPNEYLSTLSSQTKDNLNKYNIPIRGVEFEKNNKYMAPFLDNKNKPSEPAERTFESYSNDSPIYRPEDNESNVKLNTKSVEEYKSKSSSQIMDNLSKYAIPIRGVEFEKTEKYPDPEERSFENFSKNIPIDSSENSRNYVQPYTEIAKEYTATLSGQINNNLGKYSFPIPGVQSEISEKYTAPFLYNENEPYQPEERNIINPSEGYKAYSSYYAPTNSKAFNDYKLSTSTNENGRPQNDAQLERSEKYIAPYLYNENKPYHPEERNIVNPFEGYKTDSSYYAPFNLKAFNDDKPLTSTYRNGRPQNEAQLERSEKYIAPYLHNENKSLQPEERSNPFEGYKTDSSYYTPFNLKETSTYKSGHSQNDNIDRTVPLKLLKFTETQSIPINKRSSQFEYGTSDSANYPPAMLSFESTPYKMPLFEPRNNEGLAPFFPKELKEDESKLYSGDSSGSKDINYYSNSFGGFDSYAKPIPANSENPDNYASLSSSEEIETECRPGVKRNKAPPIPNINFPIDKVNVCKFGVAQLPVCGTYNNKRRSFGNICDLMLRNIIRNETWEPIYEGRCKCPETCTLGIEPICVARNGVMETLPNACYYERLKVQDPNSSWQYLSKGECFLNHLNPAFQRLTKPLYPLTIKVPDYENTNFAFTNSRRLLYPTTVDVDGETITRPILNYPSDLRKYRQVKKSTKKLFENKLSKSNRMASIESSTGSSSVSPAANDVTTTTKRPYDQITTIATTTTKIKATSKLIPFKKPITRFVISARKQKQTSVYGSSPDSAIMRLAKSRASSRKLHSPEH